MRSSNRGKILLYPSLAALHLLSPIYDPYKNLHGASEYNEISSKIH